MEGVKFDKGKLKWSLLPWSALADVVKVLMYGEKKYDTDNWKRVENAVPRYKDALFRHITAYMSGEKNDKESGLSHLAHACADILFLIYFSKQRKRRYNDGKRSEEVKTQ